MGAATARPEAGLVDLLDRVLDRGLVIHADIMITLAGIETMMADPQMREWDARVRARSALRAEAVRAIQAAEPAVDVEPGEAIVA